MKRRMWRYLTPVLLLSVLINISKFFEGSVSQNHDGEYIFRVTSLRQHPTYSAITNWMRLIFLSILPLAIIVFLNYKVYKDVKGRRRQAFERKYVSRIHEAPHSSAAAMEMNSITPAINIDEEAATVEHIHEQNRRTVEDKLAAIFLVIILGFVFCHLPRVTMDIHEIFTLRHSIMCKMFKMPNIFPAWCYVAVYVSHFGLVASATMNMFIYAFMSASFREELERDVCKKHLPEPG